MQDYRMKVIHCLPQLHMLDFRKVKMQEREKSKTVYENGKDIEMAEAEEDRGKDADDKQKQVDVRAIKAAIANAQTLEEVQRLESALANQ